MRYFIDTEHHDDGERVELISLAIVAEDGRELYAASSDFDLSRASPWLITNVLPHLPPRHDPIWRSRAEIRQALRAFVGDDVPEFWSVYPAWDWFTLVRLFGRLDDLPARWPLACWDLWQWAKHLGISALPAHPGPEHHALEDARWHRRVYDILGAMASRNGTPTSTKVVTGEKKGYTGGPVTISRPPQVSKNPGKK